MATENRVREPLRTALNSMSRQRSFRLIQTRGHHHGAARMELLLHNETRLREVHHRIGNSLQLIASMLALDARKVHSEEARLHLADAHRRILAVATVQQQLQNLDQGGDLELSAYLRKLCENLTASVVGDASVAINVQADATTVPSALATDIGLIVTELVINALKHAFKSDTHAGRITVALKVERLNWRLTIADNGVGMSNGGNSSTSSGLGSGIVEALVRQLDGRIEWSRGVDGLGTSISVTGGWACSHR